MLRVSLMHHTPLFVAAYAGHTCTNTEATASYHNEDVLKFLKSLISAGHESVLEHIAYTFNIEGFSRACLQELARHRLLSLSVKSTRWALKSSFEEQSIKAETVLATAYKDLPKSSIEGEQKQQAIKGLGCALANLLDALEDGIKAELPNDFLKYFLPECFTTDLVITLNARELRHIMKLRSQPNVLREFRMLSRAFYHCLPFEHSFLFDDVTDVNKQFQEENTDE